MLELFPTEERDGFRGVRTLLRHRRRQRALQGATGGISVILHNLCFGSRLFDALLGGRVCRLQKN